MTNEKKGNYAYIDKGGIMHMVADPNTAIEAIGRGKIVLTDIPCKYGYPIVNGEQVIVYGPEDMKLDANEANIEPIPALAELYRQCEGK